MAGYEASVSSPTAINVTTQIVVPPVKKCGATKEVIIPFVAAHVGTTTSAAVGLDIHCNNGKVIYFPIFNTGRPPNKAFAHARAHPGDTVVLRLSWNSMRLSLAVVDKTHPSVTRTLTGAGSSSFSDAAIGDSVIGEDVPVPDFGKVNFSKSKINGRALGLASNLRRDNLVNSSDVLQIKTGPIASNNQSFTTTFKHS
ncbi:MAG: G1 family glutamic endopeptidase [Solirubrobacteraceae bacterium]